MSEADIKEIMSRANELAIAYMMIERAEQAKQKAFSSMESALWQMKNIHDQRMPTTIQQQMRRDEEERKK